MTIAEICLAAAVLLAIAAVAPAKIMGRREFDNANPRDPSFYRPGFRTRSLGAHQNGIEAFPMFAAAVLPAEMRTVPQGTIDLLAIGFMTARVIYFGCYLGNRPTARSISWAAGFALNLAIFFSTLIGG